MTNQKNLIYNFETMKPDDWEFLLASENMDIKDKNYRTPLYYVCGKGWTGIVKRLLERGADVNSQTFRNQTPLHKAYNKKIAQFLIQAGANIQAQDENGNTPLHTITSPEIFQLLIENGADINFKNKEGQTPLHVHTHPENTKILLELGADVHIKDNLGNTPLHCVVHQKNAQMMLEAGADIDLKNEDDLTPLEEILETLSGRPDRHADLKELFFKHGVILDKENLTKNLSQAKIKSNKKTPRL